jgi:hypothetical protein
MSARSPAMKKSATKIFPYSQGARTDAAKLRLLRDMLKQAAETNKALAESSKRTLRLFKS